MRLLFLENRMTMVLWSAVSTRLRRRGHDVHWLVQNPMYAPCVPQVVRLPLRAPRNGHGPGHPSLALTGSDRGIYVFGGSDRHYPGYWDRIETILDRLRPQAVIGEATLFHELITSELCKRRGIPYLNPGSIRYPARRFAFYLHDTQETRGGDPGTPPEAEIDAIVASIRENRAAPEYMDRSTFGDGVLKKAWRLYGFWLNAAGFALGERHNTPSPWRRIGLVWAGRNRRGEWDRMAAERAPAPGRPCVLYPLQLQPEASLDVWGRAHKDQAALIRGLSRALSGVGSLLVKPNPKWRYEVTEDLLSAVREGDNVVPVSAGTKMAACLEKAALVVTVTGTIGIECAVKRKPIVILCRDYLAGTPGVLRIGDLSELPALLRSIAAGGVVPATDDDSRALIAGRWKSSYEGIISDPSNDMRCVSESNLDKVARAVEHAVGAG